MGKTKYRVPRTVHEDNVQKARQLGRPVTHEEPQHYHCPVPAAWSPHGHVSRGRAAQKTAKDGAQDAVSESQVKDQRAKEARRHVVGGNVGSEPENEDLEVS